MVAALSTLCGLDDSGAPGPEPVRDLSELGHPHPAAASRHLLPPGEVAMWLVPLAAMCANRLVEKGAARLAPEALESRVPGDESQVRKISSPNL
jgi:hypothetical protein